MLFYSEICLYGGNLCYLYNNPDAEKVICSPLFLCLMSEDGPFHMPLLFL